MKFENRTFTPIKDWRFDDWQGYDDNFSLYVVVIAMLRMYSCGERKSENMDQEMKDILVKVADYAENEKKVLTKRMGAMTAGLVFCIFLGCCTKFRMYLPL